jgi:hypothetical protein
MLQFVFIGIGAGVAAALLFASVTSSVWLSVPLFYLAPLPIMIAGLGWSHWAALIASLTGALTLGTVFGVVFLFAFLAGAGIPAWWLGYLAMLARPGNANGAGGQHATPLEWYPPGRLVIWAALLATLVVIAAIPNFGTDAESFRAGLRGALDAALRAEITTPADTPSGIPARVDRVIEFLVSAIPMAAAILATITNLFNLWLAARIVKFSGRLARPWPQLSDLRFPPVLAAALALAVVFSFVGGLLGIVASVAAASLLLAYGVLGFAVLHAVTQGLQMRPFLLGLAYAAVFLIVWPILALCLLGLIDTAFDLRGRIARKRGPPAIS